MTWDAVRLLASIWALPAAVVVAAVVVWLAYRRRKDPKPRSLASRASPGTLRTACTPPAVLSPACRWSLLRQ